MTTSPDSFYEPLGDGLFRSTPRTAGPWSAAAQHGGPPAALLARGLESMAGERVLGRFTMDLLGPVPVADLRLETRVLRPGRSVALLEATLTAVEVPDRVLVRAQAWAFPASEAGPGTPAPLPHGPADGHLEDPPPGWHRGYLDSVEWQWVEGAVTRPGPAVVWMRPLVRLVPEEEMSPVQRLLTCVDSASGASAALDPAEWNFLNTDLTVHLLRPVVGEWVCLSAETTLSTGAVGLAASVVHDEEGPVARSAQALLVLPR